MGPVKERTTNVKKQADSDAEEHQGTALQLVTELERAGTFNANQMATRAHREWPRVWMALSAIQATLAVLVAQAFPDAVATTWVTGTISIVLLTPVAAMVASRRYLHGEDLHLGTVLPEVTRRLGPSALLLLAHLASLGLLAWLAHGALGLVGLEVIFPLVGFVLVTWYLPWSWGFMLGEYLMLGRSALEVLPAAYRRSIDSRARVPVPGAGIGTPLVVGVVCLASSGLLAGIAAGILDALGVGLALQEACAAWVFLFLFGGAMTWVSTAWGYRYLREESYRVLPEDDGEEDEGPGP